MIGTGDAATVSRFEVFAGRSAMVGVSVALFVELLTEDSFFSTGTNLLDVTLLASLGLGTVTIAGLLAATSQRRFASPLMEAVITSLTAAKRSAGSVTQRQVDGVVDDVFERTFDNEKLKDLTSALIAEEDI